MVLLYFLGVGLEMQGTKLKRNRLASSSQEAWEKLAIRNWFL
jgi:hypothetical protein